MILPARAAKDVAVGRQAARASCVMGTAQTGAEIREETVTAAAPPACEGLAQPLGSIDVSDPAIYQQDRWQPLFARLRREAPVHYCAESRYGPYWSVTSYNDIMTVELDHSSYSSQLGGIQIEDQPADMK